MNQRQFALWAYRELKRLALPDGVRSGDPIVYVPRKRAVPVTPRIEQPRMSMPACLCSPDCEAGKARQRELLYTRSYWLRAPARVGGLTWNRNATPRVERGQE